MPFGTKLVIVSMECAGKKIAQPKGRESTRSVLLIEVLLSNCNEAVLKSRKWLNSPQWAL